MNKFENTVHHRARRMFGTLLLVQWIGVLGIALVVAQASIASRMISTPLLAFAAGSIMLLMLLSQILAFRTWQKNSRLFLRTILVRQREIEQNNRNLESLIRERTRDFHAARRELKQALRAPQTVKEQPHHHVSESSEQVIRPTRRSIVPSRKMART